MNSDQKIKSETCPEEFISLGHKLADAASAITTKYFRYTPEKHSETREEFSIDLSRIWARVLSILM